MAEFFIPGDPPIPVFSRRSGRAKRISLRISQLDGRVTLTLPPHLSQCQARSFAHSKVDWIKKHLAARNPDVFVQCGTQVPVLGQSMRIVAGQGKQISVRGAEIVVPGAEEDVAARVQAYLKHLARDRLAKASDDYASQLGKSYTRLTLRDTRSRWGSCSSSGALMFSWRLIMAPPEVMAYVAAHEVAHLSEMNHSSAFWSKVEQLYGPYHSERTWLREHGATLHRYRFERA
ncbi:MAG: SprT family zinc-dependent metalloprotease [Pseudomonadota bacterium]